jgi:hypothetical protein
MATLGVERRTWRPLDAALCFALLYSSSVGAAGSFNLLGEKSNVAWPHDPWLLGIFTLSVTVFTWIFVMSETRFRIPDWAVKSLTVLALGIATCDFAYYFHYWAPGSDSADALEVGSRLLTGGSNPYSGHTWGGSPLSPMLGGILLATPFVLLLGSVFVRGLFWLYVVAGTLTRWVAPSAAFVVVGLGVSTPLLRAMLPNQNDHFVIGLSIGFFALIGWLCIERTDLIGRILSYSSGLLIGLAFADRFTYWVAAVPLAVVFVRRKRPNGLIWAGLMVVTTGFLALAPMFFDSEIYLHSVFQSALNKTPSSVPNATLILLSLTGFVTIILTLRVRSLSGALGVGALSVFTLIFCNALLRVPEVGWSAAIHSYESVAFNGSWLILGLFSLALPRWKQQGYASQQSLSSPTTAIP